MQKKVCFVTTDHDLLTEVLYNLSKSVDCYEVGYATEKRHDVYFGHIHFTNESAIGDTWARYESHPKFWVTIQDDEFCDNYKSLIRNYQA